jgi:nucleotide-binding universal stress UspA family protein
MTETPSLLTPGREGPRIASGKVLAYLDGSEWSIRALTYLSRQPEEAVTLLCVLPRGDPGYLECGRAILEVAMHRSRLEAGDVHVKARIEVGDPVSRMREVCREERPVLITMGAAGSHGTPISANPGEAARTIWEECGVPLLLVSPRGIEWLAGDERLLVLPSRDLPRRAGQAHCQRMEPDAGGSQVGRGGAGG